MEAGGPYTLTLRCGQETLALADVMIGEVWLCGGQSNMEFRLRDEQHFRQADALGDSRIRFFEVPQTATVARAEALERGCAWKPLAPGACGDVSAVAFHAARAMAQRLNVAVGMIVCCLGDTSASCWMSRETLSGFPEGRAYLADFEAHVAGKTDEQFERESAAYQQAVGGYNAASAALKAENPAITFAEITSRIGVYPWPPPWGRTMLRRPAGPYETILSRIAPFTLRGFLYDQGEQDAALGGRLRGGVCCADCPVAQAVHGRHALFRGGAAAPLRGGSLRRGLARHPGGAAGCDRQHGQRGPCLPAGLRRTGQCAPRRQADPRAAAGRTGPGPCVRTERACGRAAPGRGIAVRRKADLTFTGTGGSLRAQGNAQSAFLVEGAQLQGAAVTGSRCILDLRDAGSCVRVRYGQANWPEAILAGESGLPVFPFDMTVRSEAPQAEQPAASTGS